MELCTASYSSPSSSHCSDPDPVRRRAPARAPYPPPPQPSPSTPPGSPPATQSTSALVLRESTARLTHSDITEISRSDNTPQGVLQLHRNSDHTSPRSLTRTR